MDQKDITNTKTLILISYPVMILKGIISLRIQSLTSYLLASLFLLVTLKTIRACDAQVSTAGKHMKLASTVISDNPNYQRKLHFFFARSTCENVTSQLQSLRTSFSDCFWHCHFDDTCVAFLHEAGFGGVECRMCYMDMNRNHSDGVVSVVIGDLDSVDDIDLRHFVSMEHLAAMNVMQLTSCSEVKSLVPNSVDGEYCLSINGTHGTQGTRIYCNGLDTSETVGAYLTLPTSQEENFSFTHKGNQEAQGRVEYQKISLDLENMWIEAWDETFAAKYITNEGHSGLSDCYPALGKAFSCTETLKGIFSIDLTGTGFYIPNTVTWIPYGNAPDVNLVIRTSQRVRGECWSGPCAGCAPSTALPGYDPSPAFAYMVYAASRVIDIRYDASIDDTICTPEWVGIY